MIFIETIAAISAAVVLYRLLVARQGNQGPSRGNPALALSAALAVCIVALAADVGMTMVSAGETGLAPIRLPAVLATIALLAGAVLLTGDRAAVARGSGGVLERLPSAYIRTDRTGIVRVASGAAEQLFGYPISELIGRPAAGFYRSPEDRQRLIERVKDAGGSLHLERTRMRRRDGSTVIVDFTTSLIADGSDCDGGLESLVRDATREHEIEETGRKNEERFRDFAESASDWLWETDADHRIQWLSDSFKRRSTQPPSEIIGRLFWEAIGSERAGEMPVEELQRWMKAELPIRNFRYSSTGPDGRLRWRRASGRPCRDPAGRFTGYRGVTSDITAGVEAEYRFQSLIEASPDMIFVHRDDRIVYVNPALVAGFAGSGPEDFLDQDTLVLCHPDEHDAVRLRRTQQQRGEIVAGQIAVRLRRNDGSDFYGESSISNISWDGDLAVLVILRDVSARRALEEKVRESEQQYRNLIELLPDAFCIQCDGRIVYANASARKMFAGDAAADLVGTPVDTLIAPESLARIAIRRASLAGGQTLDRRERMTHRRLDGTLFEAEIVSGPIFWGGRQGNIALITDVSDKIESERARMLSESRFRGFAEATSDWFWESDGEHRIAWLSDTFGERSGLDPAYILGTKLWETMARSDDEIAPADRFRALMDGRRPFRNMRFQVLRPDVQLRWRATSGQPQFSENGRFLGYRGATADITQEVVAETRFQQLIEESPDAIFVQHDDRIVYANPQLIAMYRATSADQIVGTDTLTLYPPERHDTIRRRRNDLASGGTVSTFLTHRLVRKDGSEFFGETLSTVIDWEGRESIMVVLRDVTDRVRAEEKARESELQFRRLIELLPDAFLVRRNDRIVFANASAHRLFGADRADSLIGIDPLDLVAPESHGLVLARRAQVSRTGRGVGRERIRQRRLDGGFFDAETVAAQFDWGGEEATMLLIADVSDRVAAEKVRQEAEVRFRDFAEATSDWFWETDAGLRFTWFSTPRHPLNLMEADDIVGRLPWEVGGVSLDDNPAWHRAKQDIWDKRLPFRDLALESRRPDGTVYHVSLSATPRFDENGAFLGYRGSTTDITPQIDTENRLRQAMKMEAIGQLTGGIAHDFNNLLAIISGNLELLAERAGDDPEARDFIAPALRATGRGADLTQYLLAFSRQQPLSPQPTDINRLIDGMTSPLRRALGERIEIDVVLAEGCWLAQADPTQTENAILNLALNARDAMPQGGRLVIETANATLDSDYTDQTEDVKPGPYLMISVSDEGTGIPPDLIDRVFEPFVTTKEVGQGSGLGLSMVYGFVKQSGGHIRIYSELGKGTNVRLYLPQAGAPDAGKPAGALREMLERGNGETVLVVEDDPDVLNLVNILLTNLNYRVLKSADGPSALKLIDNGATPDLLFTDVILRGGVGGVELAAAIGERRPGLPVVFMSGYTENSIIHQGVLGKGVLLISKPFTKSGLARIIHRALNAPEET